MTFDLLSRFRKPVPARDARAHHVHRPPPMMARVHGRRAAPVPQVRPVVRRGHHQLAPAMVPRPLVPARKPVARAPAPSRKVPVMGFPPPSRKGPVMRGAAVRPHPPQRASSKLLDCLHLHFHPQKRDLAFPPPRSSKHAGSHQAPPFPPPRGMFKSPPRHVHWAPAQAPVPSQPYPYPSYPYPSSRTTSSRTPSHTRTQYSSPPSVPRYQPPQSLVHVPHRRR
ncbi:hypothetical protein V8E55_005620 [Tylopilus felleus]